MRIFSKVIVWLEGRFNLFGKELRKMLELDLVFLRDGFAIITAFSTVFQPYTGQYIIFVIHKYPYINSQSNNDTCSNVMSYIVLYIKNIFFFILQQNRITKKNLKKLLLVNSNNVLELYYKVKNIFL